jgi:bilirubin oxidase
MLIHPIAFFLLLPAGAYAQLPRVSPPYPHAFQHPLPIPPIKAPLMTYVNPATGTPIDFYEVTITPFTKTFFPGLKDANLLGYDGMFPGPMFKVEKGRETMVRFVNKGLRPASVHLHGSFSESRFFERRPAGEVNLCADGVCSESS